MLCRHKVLLGKSLSPIKNRQLYAKLLNPAATEVTLRRGIAVAKISSYALNSISPLSLDENQMTKTASSTTTTDDGSSDQIPLAECKQALIALGMILNLGHLKREEEDKLCRLLYRNRDMFATKLADIPGTKLVKHRIELTDYRPIRQRPYRHTPQVQRIMEEQVKEMLDADIIEPSDSPWQSPLLVVMKKDGSARIVNDYRRLNAVTKPAFWPLPTLDDVIEIVAQSGARYMSVADLKSGYYQMEIEEESRPYTAFSLGSSNFQYKKVSQGLMNAPFSFSQLCSTVLSNLQYKQVLSYLDDVILLSPTFEHHCGLIQEVFDRFRKAGLRFHAKKCHWMQNRVAYLGHVWGPNGLEVDPAKTEVIRNYPLLKSKKCVRTFLGLVGYYRRFVNRFSQIAYPLRRLLREDQAFEWGDEQQRSFEALKEALISPPVLRLPQITKPFILHTDACITGISYILSQKDHNGEDHPVAFGGRALRDRKSVV